MTWLKTYIAAFLLFLSGIACSQDINQHLWKNRLILVLCENSDIENYNIQLKDFMNNREALKERNILVYHISPKKYKLGLTGDVWQNSETQYDLYKRMNGQPEIVLIGLDGGVKLRAVEFMPSEILMETIDSMPIRMQEMKSKKNN